MPRRAPRVPLSPIAQGAAALPAETSRYVARVHRLAAGDRFVAFDPEHATEADAEIVEVTARAVRVLLGPPRPAALRPVRRVTLVQGIGKGDKLDAIVRDATELGATRVVPALAARSVARPAADKVQRWRRIAIEAARQCGRGDAPEIEAPLPLADAITRWARAPGACFVPDADTPLAAWIAATGGAPEVVLVVGPEGGLTTEEIAAASSAGLQLVSLGPLVLRTETVCAAALGALLAIP
jgi:16S rRNA (uracil1498-N3)-methyltransferase